MDVFKSLIPAIFLAVVNSGSAVILKKGFGKVLPLLLIGKELFFQPSVNGYGAEGGNLGLDQVTVIEGRAGQKGGHTFFDIQNMQCNHIPIVMEMRGRRNGHFVSFLDAVLCNACTGYVDVL